jgi:histone acetyltransferase 1
MSKDVSSKLFEKLKVYKNYSNDSVFFKYIFEETDITDENSKNSVVEAEDDRTFKPEYTHQIFGDEEIIFGYKNLHIDYYLTPGTLDAYIGLRCREKISPQRFDGIEPDDVYAAFKDFGCSPGFTKNLDNFCSEKLRQDREFTPYGNKIDEYVRENNGQSSTFEIYKMDSSCIDFDNQKFIDYILRVQTMLVYFIETSCFVDVEDPQWCYYLLYEKRSQGGQYRYITIGYLSVYKYYAYPDKIRSRISQVMTFPKYTNKGHGAQMVECVFRDACQNSQVIDVTAESPSVEFIRLRDYVTTKMCATLTSFCNKELLKQGFKNEMAQEALHKFKIPKLQSRRCYEILRMACTNKHSVEEWRNYRLDIKKRYVLFVLQMGNYDTKYFE